jgi:sulfur-oxidizing protein SoxA
MKQLVASVVLALFTAPLFASPAEDLAALRAFYEKRFPDVPLAAHKDGAYALDEALREQWLEMEDFPPYEIAVDEGAEFYEEAFPNGSSYADCLGENAPAVMNDYPYFDVAAGTVVTLQQTLNACRELHQQQPLDYQSEEMAALTAYIAMQSRGQITKVHIPDDPRAMAAYEDGKRFFYQRRGQLNFACSSCHLQNAGMKLRADLLSPALGHTTHWPVYRGKWERVGSLHMRFQGCNVQVRAEPLEAQSETYRNLEYFLTYMNNGMELNGPSSRK